MKELAQDIYNAVAIGRLKEPFRAGDIAPACPGWAKRTPWTFLPKHRVDNPDEQTELFEQLPDGSYRTTRQGWQKWSRVTGRPVPPGR